MGKQGKQLTMEEKTELRWYLDGINKRLEIASFIILQILIVFFTSIQLLAVSIPLAVFFMFFILMINGLFIITVKNTEKIVKENFSKNVVKIVNKNITPLGLSKIKSYIFGNAKVNVKKPKKIDFSKLGFAITLIAFGATYVLFTIDKVNANYHFVITDNILLGYFLGGLAMVILGFYFFFTKRFKTV